MEEEGERGGGGGGGVKVQALLSTLYVFSVIVQTSDPALPGQGLCCDPTGCSLWPHSVGGQRDPSLWHLQEVATERGLRKGHAAAGKEDSCFYSDTQ